LWRTALKQPKELKAKKVKNESHNVFGDTLGRVHVGRQDLGSMRVKRVKALRKGRGEEGEEGAEGEEEGEGGDSMEEGSDDMDYDSEDDEL
jgi:ribosome production factor 2